MAPRYLWLYEWHMSEFTRGSRVQEWVSTKNTRTEGTHNASIVYLLGHLWSKSCASKFSLWTNVCACCSLVLLYIYALLYLGLLLLVTTQLQYPGHLSIMWNETGKDHMTKQVCHMAGHVLPHQPACRRCSPYYTVLNSYMCTSSCGSKHSHKRSRKRQNYFDSSEHFYSLQITVI